MNPTIVTVRRKRWTLVASNVYEAKINKLKHGSYLETYRTHGSAAPTRRDEGVPCLLDYTESVLAEFPIDVYMMTIGGTGRVRVDAGVFGL